ncbi:potassium transporter KtrB [bacterium]|nr:potassium transporter KtrB [bacterium]
MVSNVAHNLSTIALLKYRHLRPVTVLAIGYALYMVVGALVLSLPYVHEPGAVTFLDNLFVSVSAVSTTGLSPVSTSGAYTWIGEITILLLIQLGGIGYMTFGSFLYVFGNNGRLPHFRKKVSESAFALTSNERIESFLTAVVLMTILIEVIGAGLLYPMFEQAGAPNPLWNAVFHSVSAFCTAGFSLFDNSLETYVGNTGINVVIGVLSYLGAIGFIVLFDFVRWAADEAPRISFTSRVILIATALIFIIGSVMLFFGEPEVAKLPLKERVLASTFQCMTASTTVGFNSIPIGKMSAAFAFLIVLIMIIGASPSGTGGGIKSTTFVTTLGAIRSALHGVNEVVFWGIKVPAQRVRVAVVTVGTYAILLMLGTFLVLWVSKGTIDQMLFEVASALGTVGLSRGITQELSALGKIVIISLMYVGRVGVLVFTFSLFGGSSINQLVSGELREEDLAV